MPIRILPALACLTLAAPVWAEGKHDHKDHADHEKHAEHEKGHDHDKHDHDDHDEHKGHDHDDHDHDEHGHDDHGHDEHGHGHEHGHAQVMVELAGQVLVAKLKLPAGDLFHDVPEAEHTLAKAQEIIPNAAAIAELDGAGTCETVSNNVERSEVDAEGHEGHHDFTFTFMMLCEGLDAAHGLDITLFDAVPDIEEAEVMLIGDGFTLEAETTPDRHSLIATPFGMGH